MIQKEEEERSKFRDYITINVSEFLRDYDRWETLQEKILPYLLRRENSVLVNKLRVWSAGCSNGSEPYSLGMLLDEMAPSQFHYLVGSDMDRKALAHAQAGGPYQPNDIKNVSPLRREEKYFHQDGSSYFIKDSLKKKVKFVEQNLLTDPFEPGFDLIVCRNVIIYFTNEAKDFLFKKFNDALRPGGILFLGGTEIISRPRDHGFVNVEVSFYKKQ